MMRRFRAEVGRHGIAEATWRVWVRQVTNGAAESTRALSRYEWGLLLDLVRVHARQAPFRRRAPRRPRPAGAPVPVVQPKGPRVPAAQRQALRQAGVVELPTLAQLRLIWALAGELRLTDEELRGYALQALGLSALRRAWRAGEVPALRLRTKDRREDFGAARRWPWHTVADAGQVINCLAGVKVRRLRAAERPSAASHQPSAEREPGEEG